MKTKFELVDGRIFLSVFQMVWDEEVLVLRQDVTDEVTSTVDDYLDEALGLNKTGEYKRVNGVVTYIGEKGYHKK